VLQMAVLYAVHCLHSEPPFKAFCNAYYTHVISGGAYTIIIVFIYQLRTQ